MSEKESNKDIPLMDAVIAWTPMDYFENGDAGYVNVRSYRDRSKKGAFWIRFGDEFVGAKRGSLVKPLSLFLKVWHIVLREEVDVRLLHKELCKIPEYRELVDDDIKFDMEESA
tara:strand:- start:875 stop:1216 length:342 start_codon:yes stop_codon:yes gene_type:complete